MLKMLSLDQNYHWQNSEDSLNSWNSCCRIRVFTPHPEQIVVLLSDQDTSIANSIRNSIASIAPLIVQDYKLDPAIISWVEHYSYANSNLPDDQFWQAHLIWENERIVAGYWTPLTEDGVEALIGQLF